MIVRAASRMLSAISLGVFWRSAPSTRAIMRSRNVSPGFEVMRITRWSDSTRVPPVTADRSPPDSRITGADSPVMADSSTEAMPSMISPSPGMTSPAATSTTSPRASSDDSRCSTVPSSRRTFAMVSARAARSVAACALPRPSAIASAKFAKRTVNHSQTATRPVKTFSGLVDEAKSRKKINVQSTLPISTTNMTGLCTMARGSSLRKLSLIAGPTSSRSNSGRSR